MADALSHNKVRYAVHAAIKAAFPTIHISDEEIPQGLNPPRFFVRLLEPGHTRELGRRYKRRYPFVIRYFAVDRRNDDMYDVAERLTEAVETIVLDGRPLTGQDARFQIENEVLYFWVTYELLVFKDQPEPPTMQTLEQEGKIR